MSPGANASFAAAGDDAARARAARLAMVAVALAFLLKASVLALFVTPLWDVPDESGHLAYVLDLAEGRGAPVYGRTPLPPEILERWDAQGAALPSFNWVAQHPPVYYALAAPFALAARAVTDDTETRLRAPRLLSVLSAALALLVFFQVLTEATEDAVFSLAAAGAVSFVPMYTHLASGTHNEALLALAGGLVALAWVRFVRTGGRGYALRTAAALAFAGGIKVTALPVAVTLTALLPRYLAPASRARKLATWLLFAILALGAPVLWLARNRMTTGHPLVYAAPETFRFGTLGGLLAREPVLDHTFKNFLGLIGWMGSGELRWFQISGLHLTPFLFAAAAVAVCAAVWLWRETGSLRPTARGVARSMAIGAFAIALSPALRGSPAALLKGGLYALLLALPILGVPLLFERSSLSRELVASAQCVLLVFSAAYLWNVWRGHAIYGQMRAVHGRYFFAVLPFLLLGLAYPAALVWPRRGFRDAALLALVALLGVTESAFFVTKVIPFYRGGA